MAGIRMKENMQGRGNTSPSLCFIQQTFLSPRPEHDHDHLQVKHVGESEEKVDGLKNWNTSLKKSRRLMLLSSNRSRLAIDRPIDVAEATFLNTLINFNL